MFSERANDGIERSREQGVLGTDRSEPEEKGGGARKSRVAGPPGRGLEQTREGWAREANEALRAGGLRGPGSITAA